MNRQGVVVCRVAGEECEINSVQVGNFYPLSGTRIIHHILEHWGGVSGNITKYLDFLKVLNQVEHQQSKMNHLCKYEYIQR